MTCDAAATDLRLRQGDSGEVVSQADGKHERHRSPGRSTRGDRRWGRSEAWCRRRWRPRSPARPNSATPPMQHQRPVSPRAMGTSSADRRQPLTAGVSRSGRSSRRRQPDNFTRAVYASDHRRGARSRWSFSTISPESRRSLPRACARRARVDVDAVGYAAIGSHHAPLTQDYVSPAPAARCAPQRDGAPRSSRGARRHGRERRRW
jgi:hypothetical protein